MLGNFLTLGNFLALGNFLVIFSHFNSRHVFYTNVLVSKTQVKTREKIKNVSETTLSVIRP